MTGDMMNNRAKDLNPKLFIPLQVPTRKQKKANQKMGKRKCVCWCESKGGGDEEWRT
jgi:hypothetical protein